MGWICCDCGKHYPLLKSRQARWGEPKKCTNRIWDSNHKKMIICGGFHFRECKNSMREITLIARLYVRYYQFPIDCVYQTFKQDCSRCDSGHPAGQCIHNAECIARNMRNAGFIMPQYAYDENGRWFEIKAKRHIKDYRGYETIRYRVITRG